MTDWFIARFEIGTTKNINTMAPLLTAAHLHASGVADYRVHLESWAEWAMYELPRASYEGGFQHATYLSQHEGQMWADTLMMTALPLAKIGLVLGRKEYVEEAVRQFLVHAKYLSDAAVRFVVFFHASLPPLFVSSLPSFLSSVTSSLVSLLSPTLSHISLRDSLYLLHPIDLSPF
jgi:rhamnogalacturonyl hydrolase YesR